MDAATDTRIEDRYLQAGDFRIRYLEKGPEEGLPVLLLHGASLGSSADVFARNLGPLAAGGLRAIAFDFPGFGLSDYCEDGSAGLKKRVTLAVMDALGLDRAAIIGHSQAGGIAVALALENPDRVTRVVVLGTGSLLPPLEGGAGKQEGAAQARLETRMAKAEPGIEDTRKLLEANLFHHALITEDELALRHARSLGPNFKSFVARTEKAEAAKAKNAAAPKAETAPPLWQRLGEVRQPLLMIYGREDRGRAADRFALLKARHPGLDAHLAEGCKHLVPWDAAEMFHRLAVPFLKG